MKVTYNWLKDFVEIKLPAQELADKLTMAGIEVKSIEAKAGDFVFEIEITSNRPDWLSVAGLAREVAAITGRKTKSRKVACLSGRQAKSQATSKAGLALEVKIEDKKDCPLYTATIIRDVKVAPSPSWLKERLELIGCRSVNNIVDITNYILFEWGEPLHAFDLAKLGAGEGLNLAVRRAKSNEQIITIDGTARKLNPAILMITADNNPVAIAGVMGGKDSEVALGTKDILLEAAIFNPMLVRRGRQQLGLQTESSYRFERGVDCQTLQKAKLRAIEMIQELAGGKLAVTKSSGSTTISTKQISLATENTTKILGAEVSREKIKTILEHLGFTVKTAKKNSFLVGVPMFRPDVKKEIDLIEEVARVYGYDKIPTTLPNVALKIQRNRDWELTSMVKNLLVASGLNEVITYSLVERASLQGFAVVEPVEIANPLSKEQEILRPSLLASLAKCVAFNLNQKQESVQIFEVSQAFSLAQDAKPKEELVLGIALCGNKSWLLPQGRVSYELGILDLKGAVENIFSRLKIKEYSFEANADGEIAVFAQKVKVGAIKVLPKNIAQRLEIKNKDLVLGEFNLRLIFQRANLEKKFSPLPLYPGITRDLSILVKEEVSASAILEEIREKAGLILEEVKVSDFYKGKQVPAGFKSLTVSCFFRSSQRTLTEEEVQPVQAGITQSLREKFGTQLRV
ncbi:MAG: phenylalanine--tRNA ligase subunit beta [Candidatus Omnitrophica bacterium]|nr:phenylalanine--tRNA ligase subunit beta [Candidatus Omnitrophota bacterium]